MKIAWTNWRTAAVASGLCIVLIVIIAALSASPSDDTLLRRPSTFFTDQSGARAIYLVLQQVLPSAEQWRFPFTELERPSNSGLLTLIVMGPMTQLGQTEAAALDAWIESGGQLILASRPGWPMQKRTGDAFAKNYLDRHDLYRLAVVVTRLQCPRVGLDVLRVLRELVANPLQRRFQAAIVHPVH